MPWAAGAPRFRRRIVGRVESRAGSFRSEESLPKCPRRRHPSRNGRRKSNVEERWKIGERSWATLLRLGPALAGRGIEMNLGTIRNAFTAALLAALVVGGLASSASAAQPSCLAADSAGADTAAIAAIEVAVAEAC